MDEISNVCAATHFCWSRHLIDISEGTMRLELDESKKKINKCGEKKIIKYYHVL